MPKSNSNIWFKEIKNTILKAGISEKAFDEMIIPLETDLLNTYPAISSDLLHESSAMWLWLQINGWGKGKISHFGTTAIPGARSWEPTCILCGREPLHVAAYAKDHDTRSLFYFACAEHYLGEITEKEKQDYVIENIEKLANQFYELRKIRGMEP